MCDAYVLGVCSDNITAGASGTTTIDCVGGGGCCYDLSYNQVIDISLNPIIDVSFNFDISYNPVIDVSLNAVVVTATNSDAFGRVRVSNPYTLFEYSSITGKNEMLIDEATSGGGTSTWNGASYVDMYVPASAGASVIRQSHEYIMYQPGKSKLIYMTGVLYADLASTSITARIGTFDASMGIFVEMNNGIISVNLRNNALVRTATRVAPAGSEGIWLDPLDGTGPSGVTVDFTKAQIYAFDFEWLGVGQVRCGIVIGGQLIYYYTFTNINYLIAPYIRTAKLPLRYEITSNGSGNSMHMICGAVISEGGITPIGKTFISGDYTTGIVIDTGVNFRALIALRLRSADEHKYVTVKIKNLDIFNTTNNTFGSWKLLLNPTVTAPTWANFDTTNSSVQIGTWASSTTVTGGRVLASNYYSTRESSSFFTSTDELIGSTTITTSALTGVSDIVVLAVNKLPQSGGTNPTVYALMQWLELV